MRTIGMSDYTVGEDCFDELPGALAEYGATKVAIIGGIRALAAALPGIEAALAGTDVEILETRVYGTNSTRANIAKVVNSPACQQADVLIACGGGKALDTVKTAAIELKKIVFTVPTICSNCSAATGHCRCLQRRWIARGLFVPQPTGAHLHQPQDHRRGASGVLLGRRGRCPI